MYVHSSLLLHDGAVSVGVPYSSLCRSSLMGVFLETKGWAAGFMTAVLTKIGVVTGGVVVTVLTKAELWNFTEGTFSVVGLLGFASVKKGGQTGPITQDNQQMKLAFTLYTLM